MHYIVPVQKLYVVNTLNTDRPSLMPWVIGIGIASNTLTVRAIKLTPQNINKVLYP